MFIFCCFSGAFFLAVWAVISFSFWAGGCVFFLCCLGGVCRVFCFCGLGGGVFIYFCCLGGEVCFVAAWAGAHCFLLFGRGMVLLFGRVVFFSLFSAVLAFLFCCLGGRRVSFLLLGRGTGVHSTQQPNNPNKTGSI